ncbi:beta-galactosidase-1-like protein 2 [Actinia tenebrosa]|uniref:Beta-galactosidase n=1 Tax=Actinia tenebrosa TaxID=6105 RepID=A0A6P8I3X8_ACTTE|nr:beta-galactosidase-1-like protein 2 [Actinia tenebrosa]
MTMGTSIRLHKKPIIFLILLSLCFTIWMSYGRTKKTSLSRYGKSEGLKAEGPGFTLDGKPFTILSGATHYFRIVPEYWEDRLLKLKAMGLNTVETYVAWNLHEEVKGKFVFDGQLDIVKFVEKAQELGLYVIMRPGPYICAEWDLGGLPSWLLRDPKMNLRTSYRPYTDATGRFFDELIPKLTPLQYSKGGPIIAWQVENEYLSFGNDSFYMRHLKREMTRRGVSELLITSDGLYQMKKEKKFHLSGVLRTANFQRNETHVLKGLKELQPNKPLMVTEFWSGWFDHWGEDHHILSLDKTVQRVTNILAMGSSINFYMFHGGTNFGFMNGANADKHGRYKPTVTSYDYDAPVSEAGDITDKYKALRKVILNNVPFNSLPKHMPKSIPPNTEKTIYEPVEMQEFMPLKTLLKYVTSVESEYPVPMESLPINNNGGQGYGYILYQTTIPPSAKQLKIESYRDRAKVFVDSKEQNIPEVMDYKGKYLNVNKTKNVKATLSSDQEPGEEKTLEILVENMGRVNFLKNINTQRKGILGEVTIDGKKHKRWTIYPLDFKPKVMDKLTNKIEWSSVSKRTGPGLYKGKFEISGEPKDTYLLMSAWKKGSCFINGRNLGRYWNIGPQKTLYLPKPWLRSGENTIVLFELEGSIKEEEFEVTFVMEPQLGDKIQERH